MSPLLYLLCKLFKTLPAERWNTNRSQGFQCFFHFATIFSGVKKTYLLHLKCYNQIKCLVLEMKGFEDLNSINLVGTKLGDLFTFCVPSVLAAHWVGLRESPLQLDFFSDNYLPIHSRRDSKYLGWTLLPRPDYIIFFFFFPTTRPSGMNPRHWIF